MSSLLSGGVAFITGAASGKIEYHNHNSSSQLPVRVGLIDLYRHRTSHGDQIRALRCIRAHAHRHQRNRPTTNKTRSRIDVPARPSRDVQDGRDGRDFDRGGSPHGGGITRAD